MSNEEKGKVTYNCKICLEDAFEPVVTKCGHLYCWKCLYKVTRPFLLLRGTLFLLETANSIQNQVSLETPIVFFLKWIFPSDRFDEKQWDQTQKDNNIQSKCPSCNLMINIKEVIPLYDTASSGRRHPAEEEEKVPPRPNPEFDRNQYNNQNQNQNRQFNWGGFIPNMAFGFGFGPFMFTNFGFNNQPNGNQNSVTRYLPVILPLLFFALNFFPFFFGSPSYSEPYQHYSSHSRNPYWEPSPQFNRNQRVVSPPKYSQPISNGGGFSEDFAYGIISVIIPLIICFLIYKNNQRA